MTTKVMAVAAVLSCMVFAACGSAEHSDDGTPAISSSTSSTTGGSAGKAASRTVLSNLLKSSSTTAKGSKNATGSSDNIWKAVAQISESYSHPLPCATGSGTESGSVTGSVVYNETTLEISRVSLDISLEEKLTDCTESDDVDTVDFNESALTVSGALEGNVKMESPSDNKVDLTAWIKGVATLGGEACPGGGSLTMDFTCNAAAIIPPGDALPDFSGTAGGTLAGTICGTTIDCTISGDCDRPNVSGSGCE